MMSPRLLVAALLFAPLAALPAAAQDYGRDPPAYGQDGGAGGYEQPDAGGGGYDRGGGGYGGQTDAAGLGVRVGKLEGRIREMTGQIEELQNANRKLVEQLQKFQADVDDRLTAARGKRSEAVAPPDRGADRAAAADEAPKPARKSRDQAFDPDAAPKTDPGQPKPLGSPASAQHDDPGGAPMDLAGGRFRQPSSGDDTPAPTLRLPPRSATTETASAASPAAATGAATPSTPREAYDAALGLYRDKQYDEAEKSFSAFLQKNPKSRLAADATYYLGESFAQRGRSREAAEQYLKVSTDYSSSTRAPDAMLHLGISLRSLGAKEQACATFAEVTRKYPNAPAYVKSGAERESKRAQCG
jgi:tol-pal system protein YbgF